MNKEKNQNGCGFRRGFRPRRALLSQGCQQNAFNHEIFFFLTILNELKVSITKVTSRNTISTF
jgi:hypothetical protein